MFFILLVINVYIVVYWQSAEEKNSYYTKGLIVMGLQLTAMSVLMLAIDAGTYIYVCVCMCTCV